MATPEEFFAIDLRVGTVTRAEPFPEARKPSIRLLVVPDSTPPAPLSNMPSNGVSGARGSLKADQAAWAITKDVASTRPPSTTALRYSAF